MKEIKFNHQYFTISEIVYTTGINIFNSVPFKDRFIYRIRDVGRADIWGEKLI